MLCAKLYVIIIASAIIHLTSGTPAARAEFFFAEPRQCYRGQYAHCVIDIDNDGDLDFLNSIYANPFYELHWHENISSVNIAFAEHLVTRQYGYYTSAIAADFDDDGMVECAVLIGNTGISIYKNDDPDRDSVQPVWQFTPPCVCVNRGDLNNDGKIDMVAVKHDIDYDGAEIVWLENVSDNKSIKFNEHVIHAFDFDSLKGGTNYIIVSDMDNNGFPDIIYTGGTHMLNGTFILLQYSDRRFEKINQIPRIGNHIQVMDMNLDGLLDIIASPYVIQSRNENYTDPSFSTYGMGEHVHAGGVNGDLLPDLIVGYQTFISIRFNTSSPGGDITVDNGIFSPPGTGTFSHCDADFDGDGDIDIVSAGFVHENLLVIKENIRIVSPSIPVDTSIGEMINVKWRAKPGATGDSARLSLWQNRREIASLGIYPHPDGYGSADVSIPTVYTGDYILRVASSSDESVYAESASMVSIEGENQIGFHDWTGYE